MQEPSVSADPAPHPGAVRSVDRAISDLRRGDLVVIRRVSVSAVIQAAEAATPDGLAKLLDLTGTMPKLVMTARRAANLGLKSGSGAPVCVSLGASPSAETVRRLVDPTLAPPAHLPGPDQIIQAHAEDCLGAAVDLAKHARLLPATLFSSLPQGMDVAAFASAHNLSLVEAEDVTQYLINSAQTLKPVSQARVPLAGAETARLITFRPEDGGTEHLAILIGKPDPDAPILTRLHSACLTGDLLDSLRCDCGDQLRGAIDAIARAGSGVLIYLAQEGRGIGLANKLRAYELQDEGFDTLDANEQLGFDSDERMFLAAAEILRQLGFSRVRLMTNNPEKVRALAQYGIVVVERVPHIFPANVHNARYIDTKTRRAGHLF
jgi:GTP cyclohydrolase II